MVWALPANKANLKRTFKYSAAHIWNELDNKYKQDLDLESFNVMISTWNGFTCGLYPMRFKQNVM